MPRNVRNFWLELDVDGKKSQVATGPVAKDGGFSLRILIRNQGQIKTGGHLRGIAEKSGVIRLQWEAGDSDVCPEHFDRELAISER